MSEYNGAVCSQIIDILFAILIPKVCTLATFHKYRGTAADRFEGAGWTVDAANDVLESLFVQIFGTRSGLAVSMKFSHRKAPSLCKIGIRQFNGVKAL